jgi:hypothetical protein
VNQLQTDSFIAPFHRQRPQDWYIGCTTYMMHWYKAKQGLPIQHIHSSLNLFLFFFPRNRAYPCIPLSSLDVYRCICCRPSLFIIRSHNAVVFIKSDLQTKLCLRSDMTYINDKRFQTILSHGRVAHNLLAFLTFAHSTLLLPILRRCVAVKV